MSVQEPILSDLRALQPSAMVELFILDASNIPGGAIRYFHAGTNKLQQPVVWQGNTYQPWPVEVSGFSMSGPGTLPRPNFKISNVGGAISALILALDDLIGAWVTRKRTLAKYLDAVNFGGYNPTANVNAGYEDDIFEVQRKVSETETEIVFELSSAMDLQGRYLPQRQIVANICPYIYRSFVTGTTFDYSNVDQCPFAGASYFDGNDQASTAANDRCSHHVSGCQARFPGKQALPFGGFVGAGILS